MNEFYFDHHLSKKSKWKDFKNFYKNELKTNKECSFRLSTFCCIKCKLND